MQLKILVRSCIVGLVRSIEVYLDAGLVRCSY
jgi:hypothetical protein